MHLAPGYSFTLPVKGCQATDVGLTSQKDRFIGIESQLGILDGTLVVHPIRAELRGAEFWTLCRCPCRDILVCENARVRASNALRLW